METPHHSELVSEQAGDTGWDNRRVYGQRIVKWQKATEWPLTAAAVLFLIAYAVQIIARPDGIVNLACEVVLTSTGLLRPRP